MGFHKPPTHHKLPLWSIKENRAFLEWELLGLASTSPWGDSSYSPHTLKQGTSKFYYVPSTKASHFYILILFPQNCIGSLVRKREIISDFIDLEFIDILILFLLHFSCSIGIIHIPSCRRCPVPWSALLPFTLTCPILFVLHSEVHRGQVVVQCHSDGFRYFKYFPLLWNV